MSNRSNLAEFLAQAAQKRKDNPPGPFKPVAWYQLCGDLLHIYFEDEQAYDDPTVDGSLHIKRAMSDNRIVGVTVWGVKSLLTEGVLRGQRVNQESTE